MSPLFRAYTVFVMIAQFFVPFIIMFYCYSRIFKHLKQRTQDKIRLVLCSILQILICGKKTCPFMINHAFKENERAFANPDGVNAGFEYCKEKSRHKGGCTGTGEGPCQDYWFFPSQNLFKCRRKCLLLQQTRRNTVVLVLVVLFFFVSWFPHNVASMVLEFSDDGKFYHDGTDYSYLTSLVSHRYDFYQILRAALGLVAAFARGDAVCGDLSDQAMTSSSSRAIFITIYLKLDDFHLFDLNSVLSNLRPSLIKLENCQKFYFSMLLSLHRFHFSVAMISIMSNPVLYGLLNRGFISHLRDGWTSSLRRFKRSETDVSAVLV